VTLFDELLPFVELSQVPGSGRRKRQQAHGLEFAQTDDDPTVEHVLIDALDERESSRGFDITRYNGTELWPADRCAPFDPITPRQRDTDTSFKGPGAAEIGVCVKQSIRVAGCRAQMRRLLAECRSAEPAPANGHLKTTNGL
jgi:hypothetical protein